MSTKDCVYYDDLQLGSGNHLEYMEWSSLILNLVDSKFLSKAARRWAKVNYDLRFRLSNNQKQLYVFPQRGVRFKNIKGDLSRGLKVSFRYVMEARQVYDISVSSVD